MGSRKTYYIDRMEQLTAKLDFKNRDKLEPTFLQGYSCQIMEYRGYFKKTEQED